MKIIDRRYLIVDAEKKRILMVGNLVLRGQCKRCGACCAAGKCEHLGKEIADGVERYVCKEYFERPYRCWIFPMPEDPKHETCGFRYEPIGE